MKNIDKRNTVNRREWEVRDMENIERGMKLKEENGKKRARE